MNDPQDIVVLEKLTGVLDKLNIAYVIGGSMASSAYGEVRFTQDADITVEPFGPSADRFFEALKDDFYFNKQSMYQALKIRGSFNIIHFETSFKIDIFVQGNSDFEKQLLVRNNKINLGGSFEKPLSFVSPEDIILLKLRWYSQTGSMSQRQWSDILGVLAVQNKNLDFKYLNQWAAKLGLSDLLQKAITQSHT